MLAGTILDVEGLGYHGDDAVLVDPVPRPIRSRRLVM